MRSLIMSLLCIALSAATQAQETTSQLMLENQTSNLAANGIPLDDITKREVMRSKPVLAYAPMRESDILWEKRIWRVIDTREKMNLPFRYPQQPFFNILTDAITEGKITAYSAIDDKFTTPLSAEEIEQTLFAIDTFEVVNPETFEITLQVIKNPLNPDDIIRYRIKELWYFDTRSSTLKVRILGIAPIQDVLDEAGRLKYERVLFWVHYPSCRDVLARHAAYLPGGNDNKVMTWKDVLEMRYFSSYIYKESNVRDERLQDNFSGKDLLLEADKIKQEIFNYEHDLWQY